MMTTYGSSLISRLAICRRPIAAAMTTIGGMRSFLI
jgi:hypothetical protein